MAKGLFENCHKNFWALATHAKHVEYQMKMAEVVGGGLDALKKRPIICGIFCVIEPLRYPCDEIDRLMLYGKYGIPVRTPISSLVGANSPYPLAGTLTQINAEFLGCATIFQALCPGIKHTYYPFVQVLDMRNGRSPFNTPETLLVYGAVAQMARHYNIPSGMCSGAISDVQAHQVMFHYGTTMLMGIMHQITEQNAAASLEGCFHYSHQALVLIDEILGFLKALRTGIDVTDETLAVKDIHNCADKGEYVSSKLTLKYLRKEKHHVTDIMDSCRGLVSWNEKRDTILDRAEAKVQRILKEAEVIPLPSDQQKELDSLMKAAEKEFG